MNWKAKFQFQYGAIERVPFQYSNPPAQIFQFQYGAIERKIKFKVTLLNADFNSSMVRLKGDRICPISTPFWFQFQYGAIERKGTKMELKVKDLFQFQYGAIESFFQCRICNPRIRISIPVWCDWKDTVELRRQLNLKDFNSSMVRLKGRKWYITAWFSGYFNSSMVRLKAIVRPCTCDPPFISIPVWCDWKGRQ